MGQSLWFGVGHRAVPKINLATYRRRNRRLSPFQVQLEFGPPNNRDKTNFGSCIIWQYCLLRSPPERSGITIIYLLLNHFGVAYQIAS